MKSTNFKTQVQSNSQCGFSLIEVLISIVVMTFGLLGISGLMMSGVNNSTGSDLASRANQSAFEIMDAMRANRENAANYQTSMGTKASAVTGTTTVADKDRKAWLLALERLPGGAGEISVEPSTTNTYRVVIKFANCLGSLSPEEKANCAVGTNEKREITFKFQV